MVYKCLICEKEYIAFPSEHRKYCSQKCAKKALKFINNGLCPNCEEPIKNDRRRKFCSRYCMAEWYKLEARERNRKRCGFCQKVFHDDRKRHRKKYCSRSCAWKSYWISYRYKKHLLTTKE